MKLIKKGLLYPAAIAAFLILPFSCASAPEAPVEEVEETVEETAVETTTEAAEDTVEAVEDTAGALAESVDASRISAEAAREKAVEAKAPKAVPAMFEEGETLYASAKSSAENGDLAKAGTDYLAAKDAYDKSAAEADIRRQEALAAMKEADEAIANVEKAAEEALEEAEAEE